MFRGREVDDAVPRRSGLRFRISLRMVGDTTFPRWRMRAKASLAIAGLTTMVSRGGTEDEDIQLATEDDEKEKELEQRNR